MGALGLFGIRYPRKYGSAEMDTMGTVVLAEELGFAKEDVVWVRTTFDEAIAPGPKNFDFNLQQFSINPERVAPLLRRLVTRENLLGHRQRQPDGGKQLTEQGMSRLHALQEFSHLGSGYSLAFRDLEANMDTVLQNAGVRGDGNQIFAGGMLKINNIYCYEIPEMDYTPANGGTLLVDVGNGGTTEVEPIFFLGAQALLMAWSQRMEVRTEEFDYGNKLGVAVTEIRGCEKATFNSFQHGMATGYVSAVGD